MLQRDYIQELLEPLRLMIVRDKKRLEVGESIDISELEHEIAQLLELDASYALCLDPHSLASMVLLCGIGSEAADDMAEALDLLSEMYSRKDNVAGADLRHQQAQALRELHAE